MGRSYGAICNRCGEAFEVNEGSGTMAMPLHCDGCGREWWWNFGPGGPIGTERPARKCRCGGTFTSSAPLRCPICGSKDLRHDPDHEEAIYD